MLKKLTFYNSV